MVATNTSKVTKSDAKLPAAKLVHAKKYSPLDIKDAPVVSPSEIPKADELLALRARNKILSDALKAIQESAAEQLVEKFDLVWYARNRNRFPNHEASHRIDKSEEHRDEISKLRSDDGDFHHGFHCGVLAAARMFKEQADILHINDMLEYNDKMMAKASEHTKKIESSRKDFPNLDVEEFPEHH